MNCLKNNLKKFIWLIIITLLIIGYLYRSNLKFLYNLLSIGSVEEVTLVIKSWGIWAPIISILLMVFQSIIAPIPAFLITGANGRIFGVFWGTAISWMGAMLGGILSFCLARWFGETFVKKMIKNVGIWEKVNKISSSNGFMVILVSRLIPFISFDFISFAAGLSDIKLVPFLFATGIGMLPGTLAYVVLGNETKKLNGYLIFIFLSIFLTVAIIKILKKILNENKKGE